MRLLAFRKRLMNYQEMRGGLGMKRSMRFTAVVMATVMTVGTASTAMAAEWKHDSKGWWWQNDDGSYPAASWQWLDGNHDGAWVVNSAVQTKVVAASGQTKAQTADDYSGTYVIAYNPAEKTLTDTRTAGDSTYVDNYRYYGAGWNGYTCFELVSADEKSSIFFSAPVVMETRYSTIHRQ